MSQRFSFDLDRRLVALLALALAIGLAGCQSIESNDRGGFVIPPDLGLNSLMALPRPFESKDKSFPLIQTADGENDIALPPIAGLSAADNPRLTDAIVRAADGYDILVLTEFPNRRTHVLEGVVSRASGVASIKWYLRNGYGELVRRFDVTSEASAGPVEALGTPAIHSLADQTAAGLAAAMATSAGAARVVSGTDAASAAPTGPPRIRIGAVTGAPGNGAKVLPIALKTTLEQDGLPITEDAAAADYTLVAEVTHEPLGDGTEAFVIAWRVLDHDGSIAGEIRQENKIKAGSLNGEWGAAAYDIAVGAQNGLYQLIGEIETRETGAGGTAPYGSGPVIPRSVLRQNTR